MSWGREARVQALLAQLQPNADQILRQMAENLVDLPKDKSFGQIEYTTQCLISISANTPTTPFEVIVVDDCSSDDTVATLECINGIRVIRNAENQGFIRSCNAGAAIAREAPQRQWQRPLV